MNKNLKYHLLLSLVFYVFLVSGQQQKPYVVMISLDAFRWDYVEKYDLVNLKKFAKEGVAAEALIPSFPSLTFPNHYTLATGLYPDHHGIVNNKFFDRELQRLYRIGDNEAVGDKVFYGGQPIWVTAEKQGIRTATFFWVGSETDVEGVRPSIWKKYQQELPFNQRIDTIIKWLTLTDSIRPHLIMSYFHEPDETSHNFGPNSPETVKCIRMLDSLMGILIMRIEGLPNGADINLIILSDHGMTDVSPEREINVFNHIKKEWITKYYGYEAMSNLVIKEGCIDSVKTGLSGVKHMNCWLNTEVPARLNYGTNKRCGDITLVADLGWSLNFKPGKLNFLGAHGYDNAEPDMQAVFYAKGPAFKSNYRYPAIKNVDVYEIICKILGLKPAANDGENEGVGVLSGENEK